MSIRFIGRIGVCLVLPTVFAGPTVAADASDQWQPAAPDLAAERKAQFDELKEQMANRKWLDRVADQTYRPEALIADTDRDPAEIVLRRTAALLEHLAPKLAAGKASGFRGRLAKLTAEAKATEVRDASKRYNLYERACMLRREIVLANPLVDFDRILFVKRHPSRTSHMCDQFFGKNAQAGGGLYVLSDAFSAEPKLRDVLADSTVAGGRLDGQKLQGGCFLSPDLSYDGKTILFAYTQCGGKGWDNVSSFHLFKVAVDGKGLVQLTDGEWNDFDPCWLPNGRIAFISERRGGDGRCHGRVCPIYTLHSIKPDGTDMNVLSWHESNEWQPSVDNQGMIVYTRWDYVDRGTNQAHHPWITSPDGRDARALHGNYPPSSSGLRKRPWFENDLRAIPGSDKYIAVTGAHHGQAYGTLILLDAAVEDDDEMSQLRRVSPETPFQESEGGGWSYQGPWPLSQDVYLTAYNLKSVKKRDGNHGLYVTDSFGNKELIYRDGKIGCLSPIPLRPRRTPPLVTHLTDVGRPVAGPAANAGGPIAPKPAVADSDERGVISVVNVYDGMLPWPEKTEIKALRIIHVIPKVTSGVSKPPVGYGTKTNTRRVLGTVPVESDGSAHFYVPANRGVYFQALDERGLAVQSMRSATYVHPGQRLTCQGCHERRWRAPAAPKRVPLAFRRQPSEIAPDVEGANPFNYVRLVQPVLDSKCVDCHRQKKKGPDLGSLAAKDEAKPDAKPSKSSKNGWTGSYNNLRKYAYYYDSPKPYNASRTVPGQFGARASKLFQMLDKGHNDVKLTPEELHRITLWLDCNSGFYGAYLKTAEQARGELIDPSLD